MPNIVFLLISFLVMTVVLFITATWLSRRGVAAATCIIIDTVGIFFLALTLLTSLVLGTLGLICLL